VAARSAAPQLAEGLAGEGPRTDAGVTIENLYIFWVVWKALSGNPLKLSDPKSQA